MAIANCTAQNAQIKNPAFRGFSLFRMVNVWRVRRTVAKHDRCRQEAIDLAVPGAIRKQTKPVWDAPANWRL